MHKIRATVVALSLAALLAAACSTANPGSQPAGEASGSATPSVVIPERYILQQALDFTITLTTTSVGGTFGRLDRKHSCERGDASPQLAWEGVPEGAESLALVMEDPASDVLGRTVDVLWTHWVVYSISPDVTDLQPGQVTGELLENGAKQGANDYERVQYNGPCPIPTLKFPDADVARVGQGGPATGRRQLLPNVTAEDRPYNFRLYALDIPIDLQSGADRDTLLQTIDGHVLAAGELPVNYKSGKSWTCRTLDVDICMESVRR